MCVRACLGPVESEERYHFVIHELLYCYSKLCDMQGQGIDTEEDR